MKYSIQGRYILYRDQLINGYICIENEFIKHILIDPNPEYPIKYIYENQVIMAAGIDTNVSLTMWNHIEDFTKLAIVGGISLIVNRPYLFTIDQTPQLSFENMSQQLQNKSQTDFIQMAKITQITDIEQLLKLGAYCFLCHLMPSYSGTYCKDNIFLQNIIQSLPKHATLFIHAQSAVDKDLGITSPFRTHQLTERLNITQLDLVDADGVSGQLSDTEEMQNDDPKYMQQIDYLNESNSPIKEIVKKYKNSDEKRISQFSDSIDEPTSPKIQSVVFKQQSKQDTEKTQLSLISRAELITYHEAPKMEPTYKFPAEETTDNQDSSAKRNHHQQQQKEDDSPLDSKKDSNQHDSNQKHSPQMSIQSSDISSPESLSLKSGCRLRTRSQTTNGLLQRRQSKTGFALVLHQVEPAGKHGSGDMLLLNFSESRPRQHQNNCRFNRDYLCFLAFRPATWEKYAISKINKVIRNKFQCKIVLCGYSSSFSLVEIKEMLNQQIYSDISYPQLLLDNEDIPDGITKYKADPPIRQKYNKQLLQKAIAQPNWVSSVSSQHLYVNGLYKFEEQGDFRRAVSGVCSLGCTFQALWTLLFCKKNQDPNLIKQSFAKKDINDRIYNRLVQKLIQLQQLVSTGPAQYLNLIDRGSIEVGKLADFVVFDPFKAWKLNFDKIEHIFTFSNDKHILKNKLFLGSVDCVFIRGQLILNQENSIIQINNRIGIQQLK